MFQSTHPHGVRHKFLFMNVDTFEFQSTHPHGVRLFGKDAHDRKDYVSIHAPTRGATRQMVYIPMDIHVSIHAPTRGATVDGRLDKGLKIVSIHAPTRGATDCLIKSFAITWCFNPRTHTGCDTLPGTPSRPSSVSIHAPTRGATQYWLSVPHEQDKFQSTHPHGVRHCPDYINRTRTKVSIHAPTRGATTLTFRTSFATMFQSTHPHGVRPVDADGCPIFTKVSIHAPTRGATIAI